MAFPRNSLRAFLAHAKTSLASAIRQSQKVTLVTGNESAGPLMLLYGTWTLVTDI